MKKNEKKWGKIIALVFGSVILFSAPKGVQEVQAETVTKEEKVLGVTGQEEEFEIKDGVLLGYHGASTKVVVPEGVKEIEEFSSDTIRSIEIPSSLINIEIQAFEDYEKLEEIIVSPDNPVYSSVNGCLYNKAQTELLKCPVGKRKVEILGSVTCIGEGAFRDCKKLKKIELPPSVKSIGRFAFGYCVSLEEITIPKVVKSIGEYTFHRCDSLEEITIPQSVKSIGEGAFKDCKSLKQVTMFQGVKSIGEGAFQYCESLKQVTIPKGVKSIEKDAFYECKSLKKITIPQSVKSIGNTAFYECESLKQVTIPKSVKSIGDRAFIGCKSLKSVTIPASVVKIEKNVFKNCKQLTIYGKEGSCAQSYAQKYGIPFSSQM